MKTISWDADVYTPPVLGGAALFAVQRQSGVYKSCALRTLSFPYTIGGELQKGSTVQHWRRINISLPYQPPHCDSATFSLKAKGKSEHELL